MWRIATEVIKPRKENEWSLKKDNDSVTSDLQEVADIFNNFFIQKVQDLKANIDKEFVEDPLINLTPKNKEGIKFELKTVTHKQILKCLYQHLKVFYHLKSIKRFSYHNLSFFIYWDLQAEKKEVKDQSMYLIHQYREHN